MPYDIIYRLQVPLPYNLAGMTIKELRDERREAADEIERLRAENHGLQIRVFTLLKKLEEK